MSERRSTPERGGRNGEWTTGSRTWFFPDGDIPLPGDAEPKGHESLVMLNPNDTDAEVVITVYFEGRDPDMLPPQRVGARRVRCIRTNEPIDGYQIPFGQYALRLDSSVPIVCQIGRMDVRQPNLAYYTVMGHPVD
jgi:hypothetical protein